MNTAAEWFGSTWRTVAFVAANTAAIYFTSLVAVRIAGRRTISQLSAFDVVVTIALGSIIATTAVSSDPSYIEGATAVVTLLAVQLVVAAVRLRSSTARRVIDFRPQIVVRDGNVELPSGIFKAQLSPDELYAKLRVAGVPDVDEIRLVLLEPTGELSILRNQTEADAARATGMLP